MTLGIVLAANALFVILIAAVYSHVTWSEISRVYKMWFTSKYWTNYNIVEALSWGTKAIIIVPGLLFGIHIWWLYWFTLITSLTLIWASNKKLLPTLVAFNTLWVWLSCMVLAQHLFG